MPIFQIQKTYWKQTVSDVFPHCLIQSSQKDGEVSTMICILLCEGTEAQRHYGTCSKYCSTDDKWRNWDQDLGTVELVVPTFIPCLSNITSISDFSLGASSFPHVIHGCFELGQPHPQCPLQSSECQY